MSSTDSRLDNKSPPGKSRLPKQKVTAIARLKTLGSTFRRRNSPPPPVSFPPPSWDLDDSSYRSWSKEADSGHADGPPPQDIPEPVAFAKNLKSLIESATQNKTSEAGFLEEGSSKETRNPSGLSVDPVPPGLDSNLIRMLGSEHVMNGARDTSMRGEAQKNQTNIWNILAGLKNDAVGQTAVEEDEDGLMMYAPLEPGTDSQVDFAVPAMETQAEVSNSRRPQQPKKKNTEKHIRTPSTTELSVLTAWWGYRVYFPPPVMAKLNNGAIKTTGRAAMLATALKWLLEKIPLAIIPAQFRPAVKLLKQLSPLVGYISVFIAWSWDRVRSLDEGGFSMQ